MTSFPVSKRVFIKSKNSTKKINMHYNYALIATTILTIIINYFFNYQSYALALIKSIIISFIPACLLTIIINIFKKRYQFSKLFIESNVISISLIISYFAYNIPSHILLIAIIISVLISEIFSKINYTSSLYGILFVIGYTYLTNNSYPTLANLSYLGLILPLLAFTYLFYKKSIKYSIVISYTLTTFGIIFLYALFSRSTYTFFLETVTINPILFLGIYTLSDYQITPTIKEGQVLYGIITGLITTIITFLIPNIIIIPFIIIPLLLTGILDYLSPKLKYNSKSYYISITISIIISIITLIYFLFFNH